MGTHYNIIVPVDLSFQPYESVAERIRQQLGEGFELACRLGYTPDVTFSRQIAVRVMVGLNTFVLMSNEDVLVARFAVVVTNALRQQDERDSYTVHLGYTPGVVLSRHVEAWVVTGLHTFFLISNEQTLVSRFAMVVRDALRREDDSDSYSATAPDEALSPLSRIVGPPFKQIDNESLVVVEGDQSGI